ncbi:hypothetical protein PVAP13_9KG195513 [Panicum virgatum]|uniref:Uncharacterized protein n=1 Tax=Panicum virgatum TaxID=38727 RepID=A0A8T0NID4_PANVG|nr:hypothetical protein PVAP13_9KG195513 [Panicum virgatum]
MWIWSGLSQLHVGLVHQRFSIPFPFSSFPSTCAAISGGHDPAFLSCRWRQQQCGSAVAMGGHDFSLPFLPAAAAAETSEKCLAISKVLSVVAETLLDIDEVVALCPLMQHFCRHQQHGDYLNALLFSFLPTSWTQGMNQFFNLQWCCTPLAVGGQRTANTARGWRKARMGDD